MVEHSFEDERLKPTDPACVLEGKDIEDLEAVTRLLSKLTHLPSEQIKPRLLTWLTTLLDVQVTRPDTQLTSETWKQRFTAWVEGHRGLGLPPLSDDAISRDSIYGDDR
ncbi:MAG: hypothetical protein KME35_19950 [Aphanocapsa sp. GSE-SYN-MK-11-07L]|jgi:hypothetical protein|nr:hypothetical protein [Aphanocapsa sp. GSE-SYN-MK-11-07L]